MMSTTPWALGTSSSATKARAPPAASRPRSSGPRGSSGWGCDVMRIIVVGFLALMLAAPLRAQEKGETLQPGDNLVVEGVPSIPSELVERVNRYTEFRTASPLSWHPVRREMLIEIGRAHV